MLVSIKAVKRTSRALDCDLSRLDSDLDAIGDGELLL